MNDGSGDGAAGGGSVDYLDHYVGFWKEGLRHGWGKEVYMSGKVREGRWVNNEYVGA